MLTTFYTKIAYSTAHRPIRDVLSAEVLNDKTLLPQLFAIAVDVLDKNHHKACWILELVLKARIAWLSDHASVFFSIVPLYKHEGALRAASKICLFAVTHHQKKPGFLNSGQLQQITEACFDWLINPKGKVATKAYAMRTLYVLGTYKDWVYPELTRILSEDTIKHTAAYRAAAKDILKKIHTTHPANKGE